MLVHPEDELLGGETRFRLAFESDDYELAVQVTDLLQKRIDQHV
jgi:hypothetical protein